MSVFSYDTFLFDPMMSPSKYSLREIEAINLFFAQLGYLQDGGVKLGAFLHS